MNLGFDCILIEQDETYVAHINRRLYQFRPMI